MAVLLATAVPLAWRSTARAEEAAKPSPVIAADAQQFLLGNGLRLVVIPDHRSPVVTHMVWYKVGSADEPPGKSGIAHYLEHLMFKGTRAFPGGMFSKRVSQIGGQENAFTSVDYTAYFQRVAKEHLELMMIMEADRMEGLVLDDANARPELKVVLEERSQRTDNNPSAQFGEAMDAALYLGSPYRLPIIGWRHEIEKLTFQDALAFYNQWYTPNNAIVVVAGDVEPEAVRALADKTYGKVARRFEVKDRVRPSEPPHLAQRVVTFADERVTQPNLVMSWLVPSLRTGQPGESEAVDTLCEAIGGGSTSRLYRELVIDKSMASSIGCSYQPGSYDETKLTVYATPADGVTLDQLRAAIAASLETVVRDGLKPEELAQAKRRLIASAIHAQDSQSSLARIIGAALVTGEPLDSVKSWPSRVATVDLERIRRAAEAYLKPERQVIGYLVSAPPTGKPKAARASFPALVPGSDGALRFAMPVAGDHFPEGME